MCVVATAKEVAKLLRKGRFDKLVLRGFAKPRGTEVIWRIQIEKYHRSSKNSAVIQLAKATNGLAGSELEQLVIDSLHEAFSRRTEPMDLSIVLLLKDLVPLSELMSEQIAAVRKWAKGRTRRATAAESERQASKIAA